MVQGMKYCMAIMILISQRLPNLNFYWDIRFTNIQLLYHRCLTTNLYSALAEDTITPLKENIFALKMLRTGATYHLAINHLSITDTHTQAHTYPHTYTGLQYT